MPQTEPTNANSLKPAVLITGGARRIGAAIVEDLSAHGFAVAIHCNGSEKEADGLAKRLRGKEAPVAVVRADLTDRAAVEDLLDTASGAIGQPIRLLVNNAGLFEADSLMDFEWANWDRHFRIHLDASVMLTRRFAEALPGGAEGLVVNMIDQRVWKPTPRYFSYTLSKAALWAATRTMAQALAPNVRVNAIGPGPTVRNDEQTEEQFADVVSAVPLRRGPQLSEFGATIRYLWQTRSITGQMIALDGGQHLAWRTPDATGPGE
jgi:NAD(P)-dependent dehydrogenase (short-subunit alcohol dehydrogenase family)